MARRFAYLAAAFVLAALGLMTGAPAAWAHATLVAASPADGAIVAHAPARVSATFDEPVGVSPGSLEVFAPSGSRVDTGGTIHGSKPQEIIVGLRPGLGHGTYTVGWHVISADSHPVQGAWTFSIGAPSTTSVNPSALNAKAGPVVGLVFGVVRWFAFCCFALLVGAVGFVLWCWPAGAASSLVLRLAMGAWSGLAGSVLSAVLLQGAYGAGDGLSKVFWPDVLHATLSSRYGRSLGVRLILVIVALFVFTSILGSLRVGGRRVTIKMSVTWGVLAGALAATWAAADHAGTGIQVPLSLVADTIHLGSVALWLGGLAMLATIVLRRPRAPGARLAASRAERQGRKATAEAVQAVERFSPLALGCVGAILVTGTYQAWRGVGTWPALVDTVYGRLLLIKIGAMCVLIGLGYVARVRIAALRAPVAGARLTTMELVTAGLPKVRAGGQRSGRYLPAAGGRLQAGGAHGSVAGGRTHGGNARGAVSAAAASGAAANGVVANGGAASGGPDGLLMDAGRAAVSLRRLRWSVALEATIAAFVLGVTTILVNTATARETFTRPASTAATFNTGGPGGRGQVSITMTPAVLGPNKVAILVTSSAGKPYRPRQIEVFLEMPARHLGPLAVSLTPDGPGRYMSKPVTVSISGQWRLQITIRSDAFDETSVFVPVSVH